MVSRASRNPDVILKSLEVFKVNPEDCLMIGDSAPDMDAGRRAGVKTCGVRYGYGDHQEDGRVCAGLLDRRYPPTDTSGG